MRKKCLNVNNTLLKKLEYFIFDYSDLEYNDLEVITNFCLGNREDSGNLKNRDKVYELREILLYNNSDTYLEEKELEHAVDVFLLFLRTYNLEASLSLEALLDAIWKTGKEGSKWDCVKRITGILASIYLLYFIPMACLFDKDETEKYMRDIFQRNIHFYTVEDKRFLTQIFIIEKRFDCLVDLLCSNLVGRSNDEGYTADSEYLMGKEFFRILYRIKNAKRSEDAMAFFNESEHLFKNVADEEIRKRWEKGKAGILFDLGKYEEAKNIQDKYIEKFGESENVYDLYNGAIYYAWAADYKEKDDPNWKLYVEKAYKLIEQAEQFISQKNFSQELEYKEFINYVVLEKAFLLSEKGEYEKAFDCFETAFSRANEETKKDSNFSTHMWILMKYMCLKPEKSKKVIEWIEYLYNNYRHKKFKEYESILDFIHSNKYLKENKKIYVKIYESLLQLLFHALEIRHETKVRDISQYDILYYTKAEHLRLLLEDESEECNYRLPMFHAYHMNDPQEGKILQSLLEKEKFNYSNITETTEIRNQFEENYVFLKSFFCYPKGTKKTGAKEFLPMWVQYGDDAKGCCVILDNKSFVNSNLRRIVYITDSGECDSKSREIQLFLEKFKETYQDLVRFCNDEIDLQSEDGKECALEIESLTKYIISQISYLFKNESYKHENEVRLIINRTSAELDDVKVISGKVPKVYIYNDKPTYINEVILGAKIDNPEDYVSFIYKQGHKMWKDDKKTQIKITHSMIQYR